MTMTRRILILSLSLVTLSLVAQENPQTTQNPARGADVADSQQFLLDAIAARGTAQDHSVEVEKLVSQMTLKEKVGQMTQLDIMMVTDGHNQEIRINPEKLKKAVSEYGVGSILNVYDEALPSEKWHELLSQIQS